MTWLIHIDTSDPGDVSTGGTHLHHYLWGLVLHSPRPSTESDAAHDIRRFRTGRPADANTTTLRWRRFRVRLPRSGLSVRSLVLGSDRGAVVA
ncbi:hypothetical protein C8258_18605 [Nocardia sp. MDA0666]|nr:hypothetical protein C8258_18605 [Nocardia sp. MDA0666]